MLMSPYKIRILFLLALAALIIFPISAQAKELQAGVSPLVLDLGELEPGSSNVGTFFIVTSSKDEIVVGLGSMKSSTDFFKKPAYSDIAGAVSEEDSSKWVFFPSNPYVLKAENASVKTAGGSISDSKKVSFVLNVPKNAEPCNHAFKVLPSPYFAEEYGTGVNIAALTAITVKFIVKGECRIEGNLLDIVQKDATASGRIGINIYFQNSGTATFSAYAPSIAVYFENGTKIDSQPSGTVYFKPGEVKTILAEFDSKKFQKDGNYIVNATVVYGINSVSKQVIVPITKSRISPSETGVSDSGAENRNNYVILLILLIIIIIAYRTYRGNEPQYSA